MIRVGVLTPHEVPGPEVEFPAIAPGRLVTRVVRITGNADTSGRPGFGERVAAAAEGKEGFAVPGSSRADPLKILA